MYHGWRYNGERRLHRHARGKAAAARHDQDRRLSGPRILRPGVRLSRRSSRCRNSTCRARTCSRTTAATCIAKREVWDCNWFQQVENSLDAVHVSFAHMWGTPGSSGRWPPAAARFRSSPIRRPAAASGRSPRARTATSASATGRSRTTITSSCPGPNRNDPWPHVSVWAVPVDDTRTMRFRLCSLQENDPAQIARSSRRSQKFDPSQHAEQLFRGDLAGITDQALISAQDYVAVRGQGEIVDRTQENLSSSDIGRGLSATGLPARAGSDPARRAHQAVGAAVGGAAPAVAAGAGGGMSAGPRQIRLSRRQQQCIAVATAGLTRLCGQLRRHHR